MKKISIYDINYWIKKGFSEEDATLKVQQCKKENSCWNKEFWIKKGFSEEDAILKVKEKQKQNSLKQDKNKKENIYLIETWIKKGFSEEDSIITISKKTIKKAEEIWEQDLLKINKLKDLGYEVLTIWEYDVLKNKQKIINECINFIKK